METLTQFGLAAAQLGRISILRPDLEFRLQNGSLEIWQKGADRPVRHFGTTTLEPTAYDWIQAADHFGSQHIGG